MRLTIISFILSFLPSIAFSAPPPKASSAPKKLWRLVSCLDGKGCTIVLYKAN